MTPYEIFSVELWRSLLHDRESLYRAPIAHHRELLHMAYGLRDTHVIDADALAEMLELADAALEHAQEALLDARSPTEESGPCMRV